MSEAKAIQDIELRKEDSCPMTPNHKLTNIIKGRTIQDLQMNAMEVSIRFSDGSTIHVKVMESNSPPLKYGARVRAVSEQSVTLIISCEDESQVVSDYGRPWLLGHSSGCGWESREPREITAIPRHFGRLNRYLVAHQFDPPILASAFRGSVRRNRRSIGNAKRH
jgi:hypothetical protein